MNARAADASVAPLGIGFYTVPDAARLLQLPARNINRWLGGYHHGQGEKRSELPPLWTPQLPRSEKHIELGFRDLIELRFVDAFLQAGLALQTVRRCIEYARECVADTHPFSTSKFRTDGRTIFLESAVHAEEETLLDLKGRQYVIKRAIERTFKDLDIEDDAVRRWRPFKNKASIVIDPERAFGQPIAARHGVPTIVLADAVQAEGSMERVAALYEVPLGVVRDALAYEQLLQAA
ncbi:DUF433 domain-containing protein [Roseomonas aerophila]|uniref:DUF433 domain-containing protein n=1 Tax=Teichococcus aerophilus TaxID=1224513 RepID=A0ABR7RN64_9PROT|nr:DUF433 domain-containing protein [Pseudoroseomonas aerophila]MBC9207532.1 DUF433 domain-containing protein [Pseudoroseomonas aerophila]